MTSGLNVVRVLYVHHVETAGNVFPVAGAPGPHKKIDDIHNFTDTLIM